MDLKYHELKDVLGEIRDNLSKSFPKPLWVMAEIAKISLKQNGHCYLELSQQENGAQIAQVRGTIWKSRWERLEPYFRSVTGTTLNVGMKVLVRVSVRYHEIYGLSLDIDDINPQFTLGEKEMMRQQTIERLTKEGLMNMQKQLSLPALPYRLAVISAGNAAGYGDFMDHLEGNEYGFVFSVKLFEALMQGPNAAESISYALADIASGTVRYDAVLILRGGGSELDLSCYDDYSLAVAIARCPIPVLTAIGHEQDYHVADMVAYDHVKTPTALADYFISIFAEEDQRLGAFEQRLLRAFSYRISSMSSMLDYYESRIRPAALGRVMGSEHAIDRYESRIRPAALGRIMTSEHKIDMTEARMQNFVQSLLDRQLRNLDRLQNRLSGRVEARLAEAASHLMKVETKIASTDPRGVLKRGFVLALDDSGVKMSSARSSRPGDRVQMMFKDGTLKCGVLEVDKRSNLPDSGEELSKASAAGA